MSNQYASVMLAAILTVLPAVVQGRYSHRWETPSELRQAGINIADFPSEIGRWQMQEAGKPLSQRVCEELGLVGYVSRVYVHRDNGRAINVLLMAGWPGRLVRHPPYLCYRSLGNQQVGDIQLLRAGPPGAEHVFSVMEFQRNADPLSPRFLVAYAFSTGGKWDAPVWPRLAYGAEPLLYKVQLLSPLESSDRRSSRNDQQAFIQEFSGVFMQWHERAADLRPPHPSAPPA